MWVNKKVAVAALSTSIVLFGTVPAMAAGSNVIKITPNMFSTYQAPTVVAAPLTTSTAIPTTPIATVVGSSVVSLKGLMHTSPGSVTVVQQPQVVTVPTVNTTSITADEKQMVDMINLDRARNGLSALKIDLRLVSAARTKSQDLITNNYFSHVSPVFGLTSSLLPALGLNTSYVCENVAGNRSISAAEAALEMDIPHQQNILDPNVNYVGVGIAYGGPYGMMFTQEFARE